MSHWFCNGQVVDSIAIDDRAAHYGDGVFETIAIRDNEPRFWQLHVARLKTGCARLGIDCPNENILREQLDTALAQAPLETDFATAKIVVSAGRGPRGYQRDPDVIPALRLGLFAATPLPATSYRNGVAARLCSSRLAIQPQLAGVKSLNRLEQVLARAEWNDSTVFEGLMLDTAGRLICGTMSNMFIVTKSGLHTPAITRCGVSGIMRQHLLGLLQDDGLKCDVRDIRSDELDDIEELFLSNSQFGVLPVHHCGLREWPVGPVTKRIQALAAGNGVAECAP